MEESHSANKATLIFPSLPPTILLGLDTLAVTPSAKFLGFTQIPEGWHFLYAGANAVLSTRSGYWLYVPEAASGKHWLRIFKWDTNTESLEGTGGLAKHAEWQSRLQDASNREVHGRLLPYKIDPSTLSTTDPSASLSPPPAIDFRPLTSHITAALLNHVTSQSQHADSGLWLLSTSSSAPEDRDDIPGLDASDRTFTRGSEGMVLGEERELCFLGINLKQTWREGAVGRERTIDARDRSGALERIVKGITWPSSPADERAEDQESQVWGSPVLGEMQICFLMVLLLSNWSCLEEWKRLLELVLTCRELVARWPDFFAEFLRILQRQLDRCADVEGGLFDVGGEGAGFLKKVLQGFRTTLKDLTQDDAEVEKRLSDVRSEMDALDRWVSNEWNWELNNEGMLRKGMLELEDGERVEVQMDGLDADEETGEYAPVIVEMDQ
jgi:A1 cistron-splicing factor AAR2